MVVGQEVRVLDIEQSNQSTSRTERNYFDLVQPGFGEGEDVVGDNGWGQTSEDVENTNKCG